MKTNLFRIFYTVKLAGLISLAAIFAGNAAQAQDIIVDNRDAYTRQIGFWWASSGPNPYLGHSLYNQNRDGSFTWFPVLPEAGDYEVFAWWTYHENRSTAVPYRIKHDDGTFLAFVNQRDPALGGQWNALGTYSFSGRVVPEISLFGKDGQVSADAVRFVRVAEQVSEPWPEGNCPCDPYYSRAVDLYVAWGGSLIPQDLPGGAATVTCDRGERPTLVTFKTFVNGSATDSVTLRLFSVVDEPGFAYECLVILDSSLHPRNRIQSRSVHSSTGEWADACAASVLDFCPE